MREYNNSNTAKETTEQKKARLAKMRGYNNSNTAKETTEQRKVRLAKMREHNNSKRQNETAQKREARLAKEQPLLESFITLYVLDHCIFALAVTRYGINILSNQQTD